MAIKDSTTWGIDKRIIIGLIVAIILSLGTSTYNNIVSMTRTDLRLGTLEKQVADLDNILVNIATIQANQGYNANALARIERRINKQ